MLVFFFQERANLLDSLFESETDEDDEGGESLDTSSDSHPDEKQFLKLLGGPGGDRGKTEEPFTL